jgi:hypothetical protein
MDVRFRGKSGRAADITGKLTVQRVMMIKNQIFKFRESVRVRAAKNKVRKARSRANEVDGEGLI